MKRLSLLVLAITLTFVSAAAWGEGTPLPSPGTADVMKLAKSGVGDDILLSFVQNSRVSFHLTAEDILALKEAKVGNEVIKAMLAHDTPAPVTTPTATIDPDPTPEIVVPVYGYPPYFGPYPWHRRHVLLYGW